LTFDIRLSPGADRVLDAVASGKFANREGYLLRLQAERLLLVTGFDQLACRDSLDFSPFDYQVKAAQTALRRFRGVACCVTRSVWARLSRLAWCSRNTWHARWPGVY